MTLLRKFACLSFADKALLLRAFLAVLSARLRLLAGKSALTCAASRPARGAGAPAPTRSRRLMHTHSPARIAWAVRHASRLVPGTKCLAQSLALHRLLQQAGHTAIIRIGVAKDRANGFQAHAWVEHPAGPLLNTPAELEQYAPLASFPGGAP